MKRIINFFTIILIVSVLVLGASLIVQKLTGNVPYLFNYTYFLNTGKSMLPSVEPGDLIIVKKQKEYLKNDVITYKDNDGNIVTHRIIDISSDGYQMKGDNNKFIDERRIKTESVYGKVVANLFNAAGIINFFNSHKVLIITFLTILLVVIGFLILGR